MDTPGPADNRQQSNTLKIMILGLALAGLITLVLGSIGAYFAFSYIRSSIESTSLAIPLLANQPVKNQIAFIGNDENLWLVSPDGQNPHKITSDSQGYRFPTWAPDGRRLAFIGPDETNSPALYISPTSNSEPVVVFNKTDSTPFYLYWAPDSKSITFLTQESSGLAMRQIDTRDPESPRTLGQGNPFYWVWSPESDKMLMHVGGSRDNSPEAHISILQNQEGAERVELDLAPGRFQAPLWSSDGKHFYYIAKNNDSGESIFRTNAETLEQSVVTNLGNLAQMVLSPTDKQLAYLQFQRGIRRPFGRAYLVDTDGKNHKKIMDDPIASIYWSPDGTKLALLGISRATDGPTARLGGLALPLPQQEIMLRWWIYSVETEELEPLISFAPTRSFLQTVPFFDQYHLSLTFWSPDSRYLVVTKKKPNEEDGTVWVVDTTGREEPRRIGQGTLAIWSWQ